MKGTGTLPPLSTPGPKGKITRDSKRKELSAVKVVPAVPERFSSALGGWEDAMRPLRGDRGKGGFGSGPGRLPWGVQIGTFSPIGKSTGLVNASPHSRINGTKVSHIIPLNAAAPSQNRDWKKLATYPKFKLNVSQSKRFSKQRFAQIFWLQSPAFPLKCFCVPCKIRNMIRQFWSPHDLIWFWWFGYLISPDTNTALLSPTSFVLLLSVYYISACSRPNNTMAYVLFYEIAF